VFGRRPEIVAFHWYSWVDPTVMDRFVAVTECAVQLSAPERPYITDPVVTEVVVAQFTSTPFRTRSVR